MDGADHPRDGLELQIIEELRHLLAEMEIVHENDAQQSLAALLSRAWATFLDDVCFGVPAVFDHHYLPGSSRFGYGVSLLGWAQY